MIHATCTHVQRIQTHRIIYINDSFLLFLNEKHQPDAVNKYIFYLCSVSTCFGQNIAHHQEINKMYKSAYGVRPVIRNSI